MRRRSTARRDGGFALAALIVMVSVLMIMLTVAAPVYRQRVQREMEEELIFRGEEYIRAILKYQRRFGVYPPDVEALLDTNGIRFLRRAYVDPITGEEFRLLTANPAGGIEGSTIYSAQDPVLFQDGPDMTSRGFGAPQGGLSTTGPSGGGQPDRTGGGPFSGSGFDTRFGESSSFLSGFDNGGGSGGFQSSFGAFGGSGGGPGTGRAPGAGGGFGQPGGGRGGLGNSGGGFGAGGGGFTGGGGGFGQPVSGGDSGGFGGPQSGLGAGFGGGFGQGPAGGPQAGGPESDLGGRRGRSGAAGPASGLGGGAGLGLFPGAGQGGGATGFGPQTGGDGRPAGFAPPNSFSPQGAGPGSGGGIGGPTGAGPNPFSQGAGGIPQGGVLSGLVGVAPTNEAQSIKFYNGRNNYYEWEFLALPQVLDAQNPMGGQDAPTGQPPPFDQSQPTPQNFNSFGTQP